MLARITQLVNEVIAEQHPGVGWGQGCGWQGPTIQDFKGKATAGGI
jgi:hypothetical protein